MKILLISNMYPSEHSPHLGAFVKNARDSLIDNGYQVKLCVLDRTSSSKFAKLKNYSYLCFKIFWLTLISRYDYLYVHYASHCYFPVKLANIFRRKKVIIHVHGGDVKRLSGANALFFKIKEYIVKFALYDSTKIIFPSEAYLDYTTKEFNIFPGKCYVSASGGVDIECFTYKPRTGGGHLKILFAGRLIKSKRVDIAISAVDEFAKRVHKKVSLSIVGNGPELKALKEQAISSSQYLDIIFHEAVGQSKLAQMYHQHDFLIYPSESESLGLVPLEAMASGVIPVLSDIPAFKEFIVNGENGFLCNNLNDYINALVELYSLSVQEREIIRKNAFSIVKSNYTKEMAEKSLLEAFKCL